MKAWLETSMSSLLARWARRRAASGRGASGGPAAPLGRIIISGGGLAGDALAGADAGGQKAEEVGCPQRGQSGGGGSPAAAMAVAGDGTGA